MRVYFQNADSSLVAATQTDECTRSDFGIVTIGGETRDGRTMWAWSLAMPPVPGATPGSFAMTIPKLPAPDDIVEAALSRVFDMGTATYPGGHDAIRAHVLTQDGSLVDLVLPGFFHGPGHFRFPFVTGPRGEMQVQIAPNVFPPP